MKQTRIGDSRTEAGTRRVTSTALMAILLYLVSEFASKLYSTPSSLVSYFALLVAGVSVFYLAYRSTR